MQRSTLSLRSRPKKEWARERETRVYTNYWQLGSKIERAGCSLCKLQLFAVSNKENSSNQKLQNYWAAKH